MPIRFLGLWMMVDQNDCQHNQINNDGWSIWLTRPVLHSIYVKCSFLLRNLEYLLATIFQPQNAYCIHIDPKVIESFKVLVQCKWFLCLQADSMFLDTVRQLISCYRLHWHRAKSFFIHKQRWLEMHRRCSSSRSSLRGMMIRPILSKFQNKAPKAH